jgi:hypothetical protein
VDPSTSIEKDQKNIETDRGRKTFKPSSAATTAPAPDVRSQKIDNDKGGSHAEEYDDGYEDMHEVESCGDSNEDAGESCQEEEVGDALGVDEPEECDADEIDIQRALEDLESLAVADRRRLLSIEYLLRISRACEGMKVKEQAFLAQSAAFSRFSAFCNTVRRLSNGARFPGMTSGSLVAEVSASCRLYVSCLAKEGWTLRAGTPSSAQLPSRGPIELRELLPDVLAATPRVLRLLRALPSLTDAAVESRLWGLDGGDPLGDALTQLFEQWRHEGVSEAQYGQSPLEELRRVRMASRSREGAAAQSLTQGPLQPEGSRGLARVGSLATERESKVDAPAGNRQGLRRTVRRDLVFARASSVPMLARVSPEKPCFKAPEERVPRKLTQEALRVEATETRPRSGVRTVGRPLQLLGAMNVGEERSGVGFSGRQGSLPQLGVHTVMPLKRPPAPLWKKEGLDGVPLSSFTKLIQRPTTPVKGPMTSTRYRQPAMMMDDLASSFDRAQIEL